MYRSSAFGNRLPPNLTLLQIAYLLCSVHTTAEGTTRSHSAIKTFRVKLSFQTSVCVCHTISTVLQKLPSNQAYTGVLISP